MIDTHIHLYSDSFDADIDEVIQRAVNLGVARFYLPAIDSETHEAMIALEGKYPGQCIAMMGLHPCSVRENYRTELDICRQWLEKRKFVAIGEIGLDYYWDTSFKDQQQEAFDIQIEWALEFGLPIVIHSRNSMDETIATIEKYRGRGLKGIFHCFSGNGSQAERIVENGFLLGIGGVITYKNGGLDKALENISLEHIVLETDAPYLSPVPFRGKRNESSYLVHVAEKLAILKKTSVAEVDRITTANAQNIFGS